MKITNDIAFEELINYLKTLVETYHSPTRGEKEVVFVMNYNFKILKDLLQEAGLFED